MSESSTTNAADMEMETVLTRAVKNVMLLHYKKNTKFSILHLKC